MVQAAVSDPRALALVLLGGDAGLRIGEIVALDWKRVDFAANKVHVEVSDWRGHLGPPTSGKPRSVPMTPRLREALLDLPRGTERVPCEESANAGDQPPGERGPTSDESRPAKHAWSTTIARRCVRTSSRGAMRPSAPTASRGVATARTRAVRVRSRLAAARRPPAA